MVKLKKAAGFLPINFSSQIANFAEEEGIMKYICLYEGSFFTGKGVDATVEEIWHLKKIDKEYREFIELCGERIDRIEEMAFSPSQWYKFYLEVFSLYKKLTIQDPFLPQKFLRDWKRKKVDDLFRRFSQRVGNMLRLLSEKNSLS